MEYEFDTMPVTPTETVPAETFAAFGAFGIVFGLIMLVVIIVMLVSAWKIYVKAGKPGWTAIVPVYSIVVLMEIIGRPTWWVLLYLLGAVLYLIPFVGWIPLMILLIIISLDLAKSFGKGTAFAIVALFLFPFVGYPMLGFGKDNYLGPAVKTNANPPAAGPSEPVEPVGPSQP